MTYTDLSLQTYPTLPGNPKPTKLFVVCPIGSPKEYLDFFQLTIWKKKMKEKHKSNQKFYVRTKYYNSNDLLKWAEDALKGNKCKCCGNTIKPTNLLYKERIKSLIWC